MINTIQMNSSAARSQQLISTALFAVTSSAFLYYYQLNSKRTRQRGGHQRKQKNRHHRRHVVIVGAGIAGLTAARNLLQNTDESSNCQVTIVEATNRVGGRIMATKKFVDGVAVDMGAEYIHCTGTILTDWITKDFANNLSPQKDWEHVFITAHADGGPSDKPTRDGKYGMYYMNGQMYMYNDETVKPVETALQKIEEDHSREDVDENTSIADALKPFRLSSSLYKLAIAGFGNTAGCTDMSNLSLKMFQHFENHWETNEIEGDYRLPEGMYSVIECILEDLQTYPNFELKLNWPVNTVKEQPPNQNVDDTATTTEQVLITSQNDSDSSTLLSADAVIVTVPPPHLPQILPDLSPKQKSALQHIGFDTAIKVMLKFKERIWPYELFNVVCADGDIPEIWFRDFGTSQHVMVCYLMSGMAEAFLDKINGDDDASQDNDERERRLDKATEICLKQLSDMLKIPIEDVHAVHVETLIHDWKTDEPFVGGGYMYPKVGMEPCHLQALAEPVGGGNCHSSESDVRSNSGCIFLAGEATNTNACGTIQAAMESGIRASRQVLNLL